MVLLSFLPVCWNRRKVRHRTLRSRKCSTISGEMYWRMHSTVKMREAIFHRWCHCFYHCLVQVLIVHSLPMVRQDQEKVTLWSAMVLIGKKNLDRSRGHTVFVLLAELSRLHAMNCSVKFRRVRIHRPYVLTHDLSDCSARLKWFILSKMIGLLFTSHYYSEKPVEIRKLPEAVQFWWCKNEQQRLTSWPRPIFTRDTSSENGKHRVFRDIGLIAYASREPIL